MPRAVLNENVGECAIILIEFFAFFFRIKLRSKLSIERHFFLSHFN